jgi:SAM-dependent methyltransferase
MQPLTPDQYFRRYDESPDEDFYDMARLVTHIDDAAVAAVTQLYREYFPPNGAILDLMSSWVSHLPPEVSYRQVAGLGMNAEELRANPRLTEWTVQNLNQSPELPYKDAAFDGAGICVSIQYLTRPVEVMQELGRVLKPGAPLLITFSNRCFPTKAVTVWRALDDEGHAILVRRYLETAGHFTDIQVLDRSPGPDSDPLFAVVARGAGPARSEKEPPDRPRSN